MPCRSPLALYRDHNGKPTVCSKEAAGYGPNSYVSLRCGVCRDCRLHRAREWAIRCYHESQLHSDNCFLTLTFREDPGSISKRDLQLFFKRLRKALPGKNLRYYACGEYGEKLGRPHYHVCLFGYDFPDKIPWVKSPKGHLQYRSPLLEKCWPDGHALIGELTMETAGYTARYVSKKITGDLESDHYQREFNGTTINIMPEFQLSSRRPAIGLNWIKQHWKDVFRHDYVVYKGKECPVPTYYSTWLKREYPIEYGKIEKARRDYYRDQERETGIRMHQAATARDHRTRRLLRPLETGSDH